MTDSKPQKPVKPMHKRWWFWPVVVIGGLGAIGSVLPESPEMKAERERIEAKRVADAEAEAKAKQEKEAADKAAGLHCLTGFDGSHRLLRDLVRANLRNPDSFEHIETRVGDLEENGQRPIGMRYRAENGFGGMNVETTIAYIDNETCAIKRIVTD